MNGRKSGGVVAIDSRRYKGAANHGGCGRVGVSSMTGFARSEGEGDGISWVWEVRSVNGRALELRLRLPPGFEPLEPQLRAALGQRCRRGNVSATLSVTRLVPPAIRVNRPMLDQIVGLMRELSSEIAKDTEVAPPRLDGLLAVRGVIETVEDDPEPVIMARRGGIGDARDARRCARGIGSAACPYRAGRRTPAARRRDRARARFPVPGIEPRSQHAVLEIGRY